MCDPDKASDLERRGGGDYCLLPQEWLRQKSQWLSLPLSPASGGVMSRTSLAHMTNNLLGVHRPLNLVAGMRTPAVWLVRRPLSDAQLTLAPY